MLSVLALVLTVSVLPQPGGGIEVHEWGVVRFQGDSISVSGFPSDSSGLRPVPFEYGMVPPAVDAPVIFFHGDGFRGDFIVEMPGGTATSIYPRAGMVQRGDSIIWKDISVLQSYDLDSPYDRRGITGFIWEDAVYGWRGVNANTVRTGGIDEGFLYYECRPAVSPELDYPRRLAMGSGLPEDVDHVLLFLRPYDDEYMEMYSVAPCGIFVPPEVDEIGIYSREEVMRELASWAGDKLTREELLAMWDTWEEYVTGAQWQGDALILFPLPKNAIEKISTLSVSTDEDCPVTISRFFLGMVTVDY